MHLLMKRDVPQKFKTREHSVEEAKFMGLIVLWANQPHKKKTSALCPSLYSCHSEAMASAGKVIQIGFPRAMIELMSVGSSLCTSSTCLESQGLGEAKYTRIRATTQG